MQKKSKGGNSSTTFEKPTVPIFPFWRGRKRKVKTSRATKRETRTESQKAIFEVSFRGFYSFHETLGIEIWVGTERATAHKELMKRTWVRLDISWFTPSLPLLSFRENFRPSKTGKWTRIKIRDLSSRLMTFSGYLDRGWQDRFVAVKLKTIFSHTPLWHMNTCSSTSHPILDGVRNLSTMSSSSSYFEKGVREKGQVSYFRRFRECVTLCCLCPSGDFFPSEGQISTLLSPEWDHFMAVGNSDFRSIKSGVETWTSSIFLVSSMILPTPRAKSCFFGGYWIQGRKVKKYA